MLTHLSEIRGGGGWKGGNLKYPPTLDNIDQSTKERKEIITYILIRMSFF
jgi:hypothetical protein